MVMTMGQQAPAKSARCCRHHQIVEQEEVQQEQQEVQQEQQEVQQEQQEQQEEQRGGRCQLKCSSPWVLSSPFPLAQLELVKAKQSGQQQREMSPSKRSQRARQRLSRIPSSVGPAN